MSDLVRTSRRKPVFRKCLPLLFAMSVGCSFNGSLQGFGNPFTAASAGQSSSEGSSGSSTPASSSGGASSSGYSSGYSNRGGEIDNSPATWHRFAVRGVELGMPYSSLKGWKCNDGVKKHEYLAKCYKLMDKRCDTGRCELREDKGAFPRQWFELNGVETALDFITVTFTDTESMLIYNLRLLITPRQLLTLDSTLGKALIAKYGEPTEYDSEAPHSSDAVGGGDMKWYNKEKGSLTPFLEVDCTRASDNAAVKQCSLSLEASGILDQERSRQAAINAKRVRANQPQQAPEL